MESHRDGSFFMEKNPAYVFSENTYVFSINVGTVLMRNHILIVEVFMFNFRKF